MPNNQSKHGRRFDEEFKREVAALANRSGANQERVASDLGVSPYSVSRWKKLYGDVPASSSLGCQFVGVGAREPGATARERGPAPTTRDPKKSTRHCLGSPARRHGVIRSLAGEFPGKAFCRALGVSRSGYYAAQRNAERPPPCRPGEVWQADITYVATQEGWLYVAGVLDACSRRIVGWAADDTMPTGLVELAVATHRSAPGLLHHSDRGSQYANDAYRELLSRPGNAKMESFWVTLKTELIQDRVFTSRAEAKSQIFRYIEIFYNRARLHGALGYHSPVDFENSPS